MARSGRITKKEARSSHARIILPTYRDHGQQAAEEMLAELNHTAQFGTRLHSYFQILDLEDRDHTLLLREVRRELS